MLLLNFGTSLSCNYSPERQINFSLKRQIKSKMKLDEAVTLKCSVKGVLKYLLELSEKHLYHSIFLMK